MKVLSGASLIVASVAACGGVGPAGELTSSASSAIQSTPSTSVDPTDAFAVAVIERTPLGKLVCSGVLLAPNLVATARHCVAAVQPASVPIDCATSTFGAPVLAGDLSVTTDADVTPTSDLVGITEVIVPTGPDRVKVCGNDIALLVLDRNVSLPRYVLPAIDPPLTDHAAYGTRVAAIGYGIDAPIDTTGQSAGVRRIERNVALLCIPGDKTFLDCFSDPNAPALLTASEFVSGDASSCEGDSGSGAFDQAAFDQGRPVGLGVLSRGSVSADLTTCIQPIYTRFDAWASLLVDAAHRAASAGGYAPPAWADAIGVSPRPDAGGGRPAPPPDASMSEQMAVRAPSGCCAAPGVPLRRDASAVILCLGALAMGRYRRASRLPPERKAPRLVSKPGGPTPG